ncbi:PD-(D/E)XK nuclease-like domain-containing protein [Larkinella sp.]|uniref:PD-(D/E)XK nuclease-like domain-containing protein n=1 Tax=Larkinella sp. TaxID=2034517 RepID=UPI003BAA7890
MITELIDYRSIPRVSNSDLTRLKEECLGYTSPGRLVPQRAMEFGRAFHSHLLEPERIGGIIEQLLPDMKPVESGRLQHLTEQVRRDSFCNRYLRRSERERVILFTDPITELGCKARLDMVYTSPKRRSALILDFKTTSARTQSQFLQSCYDYDYDRQAAFYIDSLRSADSQEWEQTRQIRFVLIGVQKQKPHRLFAVDATSIPDFVDYGRKKYRFWLRKWKEQQQEDTGFWLRQAS